MPRQTSHSSCSSLRCDTTSQRHKGQRRFLLWHLTCFCSSSVFTPAVTFVKNMDTQTHTVCTQACVGLHSRTLYKHFKWKLEISWLRRLRTKIIGHWIFRELLIILVLILIRYEWNQNNETLIHFCIFCKYCPCMSRPFPAKHLIYKPIYKGFI